MESRSSKGAKKARKIDQFLKTHFGGNIKDGGEEELAEELQMPGTPNELRMRGNIIASTVAAFGSMHGEESVAGGGGRSGRGRRGGVGLLELDASAMAAAAATAAAAAPPLASGSIDSI
jgi:hypothetical protein